MKISYSFSVVHEDVLPCWNELYSLLTVYFSSGKKYSINLDSGIQSLPLDKINELIQNGLSSERFLGLSNYDETGRLAEKISFFPISKHVTISFPESLLLPSKGVFSDAISSRCSMVNLCEYNDTTNYRASLREYFTPPSSNIYAAPGLSNIRDGHLQGVASDMWFSEKFWQYASCSKQELVEQDCLTVRELENGVIHVNAWPESFSSAEGEQGVVQRRLLKLLFNIDENNPFGKFS